MNEQEVKQAIGEENWVEFLEWMHGQTVSVNEDGTTNYYESDVYRFAEGVKRWIKKRPIV